MLNAVVIYESKYGATRQYAQWIAEDLRCRFIERKSVEITDVQAADVIIYGGPIYAGGVSGVSFLRKNFEVLKSKHLVLFTCGLSDPAGGQNIEHIRNQLRKTLTPEVMQQMKVFHVRGAIDYSKLSVIHKVMMAMLVRSVRKKDAASRTAEDQQLLDTYGKAVNFMERSAIDPIVEYAQKV